MARKSIEIVVTDETRQAIEKLADSQDADVSLRARIVLASIAEKEAKKVAALLGTSESNVAKWKKKFIEGGIDSITSSIGKNGGRPSSSLTPDNLESRIMVYIGDHSSAWNAKQISAELNVPLNTVYYYLSKAGITPSQRKRFWTCSTRDVYKEGKYAVIGLYLTAAVKFIVIAEMLIPFYDDEVHGEVTTGNSDLYNQMTKSVSPLTLADTIVAFSQPYNVVSHSAGCPMSDFYGSIMAEWAGDNVNHFYVYVCSDRSNRLFAETGDNVTVVKTEQFSDWIGKLYLWMVNNCTDTNEYLKTLLDVVSVYEKTHEGREEAYAWKLFPGRFTPKPIPPASYATSVHEAERQDMSGFCDQGTILQADLKIRLDDGTVANYIVTADQKLPGLDDIDISTKEGFMKYINDLDNVMSGFTKKIDAEGRQLYFSTVKKN